jgi:hypothetical protein
VTLERAALRVGARAAAIVAVSLGIAFLSGAAAPVDLLLAGNKPPAGEVLVDDFGSTVDHDRFNYDGTYVYLVARYFPDIEAAAEVVPGARYRLTRILPSAIASVGGEGTPIVLVLTLLGVVGIGLASAGLADLAMRHGGRARSGYAALFALVLPLLLCMPEPLAFGLAFAGLALADRRRYWAAAALFAFAGLARETALTLTVVAVVLAFRRGDRAEGGIMGAVAVLPYALWWLAVRATVERSYTPLELLGFRDVTGLDAADVVAIAVTLALTIFAVVRWRDAPALWLSAAAFLAWFLVYDQTSYDWRSLPRISAPSVALGLAAIFRQSPAGSIR